LRRLVDGRRLPSRAGTPFPALAEEDSGMKVQETKKGKVLVVAAQGRLDASSAGELQDKLLASIDSGETRILLDFTELDYISSAGLRILLVAAKRLKEGKGQFAICGLTDNVASVFKISGFDSIIQIFPNQGTALASYA
jgi:anti-sigma B factor antagonist